MESLKTVEIFDTQLHHIQSKSCNGAEISKTESSKFGTRKREYQAKGSPVPNKSSDSFLSNYENDRRKKKCTNSYHFSSSNSRCQSISSEKGLSVPSDVGRITKNDSFTLKYSSSDDFPQAVCKDILTSSYECEKVENFDHNCKHENYDPDFLVDDLDDYYDDSSDTLDNKDKTSALMSEIKEVSEKVPCQSRKSLTTFRKLEQEYVYFNGELFFDNSRWRNINTLTLSSLPGNFKEYNSFLDNIFYPSLDPILLSRVGPSSNVVGLEILPLATDNCLYPQFSLIPLSKSYYQCEICPLYQKWAIEK